MKILMINKFLFPNGGSETYVFKLGSYLKKKGHKVEYFGMESEQRCVGNRVNSYTTNVDFHGNNKMEKFFYPFRIIYSREARIKIRKVLDDFQPDVCHLNNFNYQLTPSIILEIVKWRKQRNHECKIVFTAHDYQLICPNHLMNNPISHQNCERCIGGHFYNCTKYRCIHGSRIKSLLGSIEAYFWNRNGVYEYIDQIICCSEFMKRKMDTNERFMTKTVAIHNFVDDIEPNNQKKEDYILYFGRFSEEKGLGTLLKVCRKLPNIQFIFAGAGPLESEVNKIRNIKNVGFQTGNSLTRLIVEAKFSICPSECYDNCPFSVMESQLYGTPVLGAKIGGIPELIADKKTGELFISGDEIDLKDKIQKMWNDREQLEIYTLNCKSASFINLEQYYEKLMSIYRNNVIE